MASLRKLGYAVICIVVLAVLGSAISQETSTYHPRRGHRNRSTLQNHRRQDETEKSGNIRNKTGLLALEDGGAVELADKDKYYEDDDYVYDETEDGNYTEIEGDEDDKFVDTSSSGIVLDHVDFVLLRLKHISMRTSSNLTELLDLQKKEFEVNSHYSLGWATAEKLFNESKREALFNNTSPDSIVRTVPEEYHIAIIAYTLGSPSMYYEFNKDTREVCSGTDIDKYQWKSYYKLLKLAIETLGSRVDRWRDSRRFLYRGASGEYKLTEGQILGFQSFISTSAALISAENFAGKSLFEFQGFYNGTAMAIWDHSVFDHEKEVLFSPEQVFQVDSIHEGSHYTRYVLVRHEMPPLPCNNQIGTPLRNNELAEANHHNFLGAYSSSASSYENSYIFSIALLLNLTLFIFYKV